MILHLIIKTGPHDRDPVHELPSAWRVSPALYFYLDETQVGSFTRILLFFTRTKLNPSAKEGNSTEALESVVEKEYVATCIY
jgi:hypothetical protein